MNHHLTRASRCLDWRELGYPYNTTKIIWKESLTYPLTSSSNLILPVTVHCPQTALCPQPQTALGWTALGWTALSHPTSSQALYLLTMGMIYVTQVGAVRVVEPFCTLFRTKVPKYLSTYSGSYNNTVSQHVLSLLLINIFLL